MALRNAKELTFRPKGVCDAVDGSNAPSGAMRLLSNLIPDPATADLFVARPAAADYVDFVAGGFASPGEPTGLLVVGDLAYGMIPSTRNPGRDEPFCYNLATASFVTVGGIAAANTPLSPPASGPWTPPIVAQVGSRIVVTHPGFPGGATKFGWFDVSGFSLSTTGTVTSSSAVITGNPSVLGVQPGMTIADGGINIPAGRTVLSTTQFVLTEQGVTHGNLVVDNLPTTVGIAVGQRVQGLGIPSGATVATIGPGGQVTLSLAATGSGVITVEFSGGTITMSGPATGTLAGSALTIAGGTRAAPLWGAGDTDRNPLPSIPVGVAQMNGRAYFACGLDGIVYSDSGFACRVSNTTAVQVLTTHDGTAVTAIGPLMLSAPLTGGIVQALIAFQGGARMQQISGDQATANLAMNLLPVATGTNSPLSIAPCAMGLGFVSPQGLRFVNFDGTVSLPVGDAGSGVTMPFIFAQEPTRICAAANADALRVTVQNGYKSSLPVEEYWFDLTRRVFTGPHTSTASLIEPWRATFLMGFIGYPGKLYQSDAEPGINTTWIENGAQLSWAYQPTLLPDSGDGQMVGLVEMTMACSLAVEPPTTVAAISDFGEILDMTTIPGDSSATLWNQFNWNEAFWNATNVVFRQRSIDWNLPLVFKQVSFQIQGNSDFALRLGNLYMKYQRLGYKLQEVA